MTLESQHNNLSLLPDIAEIRLYLERERNQESFFLLVEKLRTKRKLRPGDFYQKTMIVDRKLYNKIRGNGKIGKKYRPSKVKVFAMGLALELPLEEFKGFLERAGYVFDNNSDFDLVVRYCIENGIYSIADVNARLLAFGQRILGGAQQEES